MIQLLEYNIGTQARAFSTMRGEGSGNYGGFNITHYCGDTSLHVAECRKALCAEIGIDEKSLILPRQTHSDKVLCYNKKVKDLTPEEQERLLYGVDAIVTDLPGICIGVSTADCIPILLHDCHARVVAAIHAGWRGTVQQIAIKTIATMQEHYGCNPSHMRAVIGPGISLSAFEVGDEVYEAFKATNATMERIAKRLPCSNGGEKWHIDLWECNRRQLTAAGIPEQNIQSSGVCTYARHREFFSARRLGINSGRIFNGIMLL